VKKYYLTFEINIKMFSNKPEIELLVGKGNYHVWRDRVKAAMLIKGCLAAIESEEPNAEACPIEKVNLALGILMSSVDRALLSSVNEYDNPYLMWKALEKTYESEGINGIVGLYRTATQIRLEDCRDMDEYLSKFNNLFQSMRACGLKTENEILFPAMILGNLPERYDGLRLAFQISEEKVTVEKVSRNLLEAFTGVDNDDTKKGALFSKGRKFSSKQGGKNCFNCKSPNHLMRDCPEALKNGKRGPKKNHRKADSNGRGNVVAFSAGYKVSSLEDREQDQIAAHVANNRKNVWVIDSGASSHMTPHSSFLKEEKKVDGKITIADDTDIKVVASGVIGAEIDGISINMENVLLVPKLGTNLLSVHKLVSKGNKVVFDASGCTIYSKEGKIVANCEAQRGIYKLEVDDYVENCLFTSNKQSGFMWHRKLGHPNAQTLSKMITSVDGIKFDEKDENDGAALKNCQVCAEGKQHVLPFAKSTRKSTRLLELVHSDVCEVETESTGRNKYFLTFIDDFSRKIFVYFLGKKSQTFERFREFKALVENTTGEKIACLRTDNGGEYTSKEFEEFLRKSGIKHETTIAHTPQQNGVAERANRTIIEKTKCLLFDSGLSKCWWAEAVNHAVYLINRTISSVHQKVPNEIFFNKRVDLSELKLFGCEVMALIHKGKRSKLDKNSEKLSFVGMDENTKGYRCINRQTRKLTVNRNVKFLDENSPRFGSVPIDISDDSEIKGESKKKKEKPEILVDVFKDAEDQNDEESEKKVDETTSLRPKTRSVSAKEFHSPLWTGRLAVINEISFVEKIDDEESLQDPDTLQEVHDRRDKEKWLEAMKNEYSSLIENKTWELCELPAGKKLIDTKWVFKTKRDNDGNVIRFKARMVAKGFIQKFGVDYEETYSPVVRYTSIRFLTALAVRKQMKIHQMDAVTAFLQGDVDKEIFIRQPEGFNDGSGRVCKLKKAIYGLKQSGRMWNMKLDSILKKLGFTQCKMDPCIYYTNNHNVILAVYVDDILFFYKEEERFNVIKELLQQNCKMKDLGEAKGCVGIRITQNKGEILLDQEVYIGEIIRRFGMMDCKPMGNPCDTNLKLSKSIEGEDLTGQVPYQQAIGALLFVAQATRPDIAFAVNNASRFNNQHNSVHWGAVKRIFRYLKKTEKYKLVFKNSTGGELKGFTDADFGSDIDSRKSMSGFVFVFAHAAVSWRATKQSIVSLSSTEAEYIALVSCVQEAIWLKQLCDELGVVTDKLDVNCDNTSTISLAKNEQFSVRSKHIDIRYRFVREKFESGLIDIKYVNTNLNPADAFTKPITKEKVDAFAKAMGLKM
jgi:transposase InsO family protein